MHNDLPLIQKVARSWARLSFEDRYARLLLSMSLEQAKSILGFPPGSNPTPTEITKAYRAKALENHPDRGGDHTKMVEINVAKDILEGKGRATWTPEPAPRPPRREPPKAPEPDFVMEGQTFDQAWSGNSPPAGVEWKFVSVPEYYWEKTYYPGHRIWTLYGQTDSKHIFLAIKERGESAGTIPTDKGMFTKMMEDWQVSWVDVPLSQNISKIATKYLKSVSTGWADGSKPKPPKKFIAWPGGRPTDQIIKKLPRSGGAALKDILVGTGLLNDEDPSIAGRKSVVEIYTKYSKEKIQRRKAEGAFKDGADSYDFFVRVNGKDCQLSDSTVENLKKRFIPWVLNWEISEGRPKNLTRMRGGGLKYPASEAIQALADALTNEPSWLHLALIKASEEYDSNNKSASLAEIRCSMTLKQASVITGIPMYDLFMVLHG